MKISELIEAKYLRTPDTREFVKYSRVKTPVYHATAAGFETFDLSKSDLGIHFGNLDQAEYILKHRKNKSEGQNIHPVLLKIENPLRLKDTGSFHADAIADQLLKKKLIDKQLYNEIVEAGWQERKKYDAIIRNILLSKGYDGVVYKNEMEGYGDSYIAISNDSIRSIYQN